MNDYRIGLKALQTRVTRECISEADFIAAVSEIVAATPADLESIDGLRLAQQIREMEHVRKTGAEPAFT
ncbi:hypothetical protein [Reyranella sp.]|uniref:hypothetical protein n=1 Tax=Reyranella sp. TaxID=1929291 RepID=UPI004035EE6A